MNATRFSMTLYISFPVLASVCSVVMIGHFVMLVEGRISADGIYSDALEFIAIADTLTFFGSDLITFRFVGPLISGLLGDLFFLSGSESIGLLTGTLNFIYLLIGFGWMYYLSMKEEYINSFEVALPTLLILPLHAFWQGAFLPVPDALMFCVFAMILTAVLLQKFIYLLPAMVIGVWTSELMLLSLLILPLADIMRKQIWKAGYIAFILALATYLAVPVITQIPDAHPFYRTSEWTAEIAERFSSRETTFIWAFWRSFTLSLPFFAYRFFVTGWSPVTGALAIWFGLLFAITFLLSPDSAHRVMFMAMPALVLWQFRQPTFQQMDKPLDRASESPMG